MRSVTTIIRNVYRPAIALLCCFYLTSCTTTPAYDSSSPLSNSGLLPVSDITVTIPSLSNCTRSDDDVLHLNSTQPVNIIVHGCFSSAGRFRSLADVFAFHGQQAICFNYDDRDMLANSADELITALEELSSVLVDPRINIIGHSQGGLVARNALIEERTNRLETDNTDFRLITISAPFGGIEASSHCGSKPLAWFSLGITKLICQIVTGSKYREIPPNSDFINDPGELLPAVRDHLKIATDETDSCRRHNERGKCVEDDFVFSLREQSQQALETDSRLSPVEIKAGHVEIVGDGNASPIKLIDVLQQQAVLKPTPADKGEELARLLTHLYTDGLND